MKRQAQVNTADIDKLFDEIKSGGEAVPLCIKTCVYFSPRSGR